MKVGIGKGCLKFDFINTRKKLILGGVFFEGEAPLQANNDADVVLHALTNAVSSVTCVNIMGKIADNMLSGKGIADSKVYLKEAMKFLKDSRIVHVALSIESAKLSITRKIPEMRAALSKMLDVPENCVGITINSGDDITSSGQGLGIKVTAIITVL